MQNQFVDLAEAMTASVLKSIFIYKFGNDEGLKRSIIVINAENFTLVLSIIVCLCKKYIPMAVSLISI